MHEIGAIKHQQVRLASGETSNLYIDLRLIFGSPKWFPQLLEAYEGLILREIAQYDGFAAVPTAGIPFATALALKFHKPFFYARPRKKEHGMRRLVEGGSIQDLKLVLIDDLISSGHSKLPVIETLRDAGAIIDDVCVLLDRELGGAATLEEHGLKLHAVALISELDTN